MEIIFKMYAQMQFEFCCQMFLEIYHLHDPHIYHVLNFTHAAPNTTCIHIEYRVNCFTDKKLKTYKHRLIQIKLFTYISCKQQSLQLYHETCGLQRYPHSYKTYKPEFYVTVILYNECLECCGCFEKRL